MTENSCGKKKEKKNNRRKKRSRTAGGKKVDVEKKILKKLGRKEKV